VSRNVTTYSGSDLDACCFSAGRRYEDSNSNNKVFFPIPLSRLDLLVIEVLLPVTDWYSRDLGIDPMHFRESNRGGFRLPAAAPSPLPSGAEPRGGQRGPGPTSIFCLLIYMLNMM
jgi:hypothetical protein